MLLKLHGVHESVFPKPYSQPMLDLTLRQAAFELELHRAAPPSAALAPTLSGLGPAEKALGSASLAFEAAYLNLSLNKLEPLCEPFVAYAFALKPPHSRKLYAKAYSDRVLQLNASLALKATVEEAGRVFGLRQDGHGRERDIVDTFKLEDRASDEASVCAQAEVVGGQSRSSLSEADSSWRELREDSAFLPSHQNTDQ